MISCYFPATPKALPVASFSLCQQPAAALSPHRPFNSSQKVQVSSENSKQNQKGFKPSAAYIQLHLAVCLCRIKSKTLIYFQSLNLVLFHPV